MHNFMIHICTICGREKTKPGWFMVAENRWEDRLKILEWNDCAAWVSGVHEACSAAHVLELVDYWVRTNSLNYPFERTHPLSGSQTPAWRKDPDLSGVRQLGELYVDRENIGRVLDKNPDSLSVILDELLFALQPDNETRRGEEANVECDVEFAGAPR